MGRHGPALHVHRWQRQFDARLTNPFGGRGSLDDRRGIRAATRACVGRGRTREEELLDGDPPSDLVVPFRSTYQGFAAADAVAPSLAFTGASAKKLLRAAGFYSIRVTLSLRDDVEGNAVAYRLGVKEGPEHPRDRRLLLLDSKEGSTASGSVSTTLRVFPSSKRVRTVQLLLSGSDPVGNEVSITRTLKLPRP